MQNPVKTLLLPLLLAISAASCTHNNGDIGFWFGTWQVDQILLDGVPDSAYTQHNMFFQFQTAYFKIVVTEPHNATTTGLSYCEVHDDQLLVNFNFTSDAIGAQYDPPKQSHLLRGLDLKTGQPVWNYFTYRHNGRNLTLTTFNRPDSIVTIRYYSVNGKKQLRRDTIAVPYKTIEFQLHKR